MLLQWSLLTAVVCCRYCLRVLSVFVLVGWFVFVFLVVCGGCSGCCGVFFFCACRRCVRCVVRVFAAAVGVAAVGVNGVVLGGVVVA